MRSDDDSSALPPRSDRRWIHPSEVFPPRGERPQLSGSDTRASGGVGSASASRWTRLRRLPIGTTVVATATGAVGMFVVMSSIGVDHVPSGDPAATEPVASARGVVARTSIPTRPHGVVTVSDRNVKMDGVVTPAGVVVLDAPEVGSLAGATVVDVDGNSHPVRLAVEGPAPGLRTLLVDDIADAPARVSPPRVAMHLRALGASALEATVVALNHASSTSTCRAVITSTRLDAGSVLASGDHVVGIVSADDPNPEDLMAEMIPVSADAGC